MQGRSFRRLWTMFAAPAASMRPAIRFIAGTALALLVLPFLAHPGRGQALDFSPLPKGETRTVKLAVGGVADTTHIAVWYAKYGGFFDKLKADGIEVEVVPFGGGSEWLLALTSGQTQMAHGYFENAVRAHTQGRDVVSLFNVLPTPIIQEIVRKDLADKIKTVADAKGVTWGFTSFGSATHVVALRVAKHYGLDPSTVKWVPVGGTTGFLPAIREKRVDVLSSTVVAANQLIQEGAAQMLVDLADPKMVKEIYGTYLGPALLSSKNYIAKNPFVVYKVTQAVQEAIRGLRTRPADEIARVLPDQFQSPVLKVSIESIARALNEDGITSDQAVEAMLADMTDLKVGKGTIKLTDIVDNRIAEALRKKP